MSGWFYIKEGMLSDEQVGPMADNELLQMALEGTLKPKTKVAHEKHTRGQWTFLENIPAAKKDLEAGERQRAEKLAAERAAKQQAKQQAEQLKEQQRAAQVAQQTLAAANNPISRFITDGQDMATATKVHSRVSSLLTSNESIDYIAITLAITSPDCVVATNRRFMVVHQKLLGRMEFEDYQWLDLSDAQVKEGMVTSKITLKHISGRTLKVDFLPKGQAARIYRICQEREEESRRMRHDRMLEEKRATAGGGITVNVPLAAPAAAAAATDDPVAKLQKLKQMLDAGLIEKAEYDDTKRRILSAM